MYCVSCQAQLATRSKHCYFCGAAQTAIQRSSRTATGTAWLVANPAKDGWRTWASFFLGGLYGPFASAFLLARERAGVLNKQPPTSPSNRGLVVLGFLIGLPALLVMVLQLPDSIPTSHQLETRTNSYGHQMAARWTNVNMFIAWFYLASALLSRRINRCFGLLLYEVTAGSTAAVSAFQSHRLKRYAATLVATVPMVLICLLGFKIRHASWGNAKDLAGWYVLAVLIAAYASSWLHIEPLHRYRAAALANLP